MPLEKEILNRTPMRDELRSGESIIVKDEYGEIYEATNIDGYIYRTPLYRDDEDFSFGRNTTFMTTEDGNSETSGGGGSIEVSPGENTFTILDSQGSARVILGQTDDSPKYGIKINDHIDTLLLALFNSILAPLSADLKRLVPIIQPATVPPFAVISPLASTEKFPAATVKSVLSNFKYLLPSEFFILNLKLPEVYSPNQIPSFASYEVTPIPR